MINRLTNIKISKKWSVFSIFVFFSLILWFLNALNQEYTTEIRIPVEYSNMPKNKANISELPDNLKIAVKAYGFKILKYQFKKKFVPFIVDLSSTSFSRLYQNDSNWYYSLTKEYIDQIDNQFQGDMKVEFLKPDTLYFHFTKLIKKRVPILSDAKIITAEQYIIKDNIHFNPDSVTLKGPALLLDTINYAITENIEFNDLSTNITEKIKLKKISGVEIIPQEAKLTANIEEYTELNFKVNITSLNVPDSVYFHLFPNYVTIVCKVGISNYKNVSANDFQVVVDYNSILENMGNKLLTKIISYPSNVYDYYQTPEFIEYVIEKK